jgi:hypothetical protein
MNSEMIRRARRRAGRSVRRILSARSKDADQRATPATNTAEPPARKKKPRTPIDKSYPRNSSDNLYDAVDFLRALEVERINSGLVAAIAEEIAHGRELRVVFAVSDRSKWNCTSLLHRCIEEGWEVQICLFLDNIASLTLEEKRTAYLDEQRFFGQFGVELKEFYDPASGRQFPIEDVRADIVFYQQPWGMMEFPRRMTGRALNVYMHYGFALMANLDMHYHMGPFHSYLWRYLAPTEGHRDLHLQHDPSAHSRSIVSGYPKLDVYVEEGSKIGSKPAAAEWSLQDSKTKRIIFAPHHALAPSSLRMSTFRWTHLPLLELARNEPDVQWVYKPHPGLKRKVVKSGVMTLEEYQNYEQSWANLPNAIVYDSGEYFDLFKASDILITDSGSFLAEYLPTGNPIVWLMQADAVKFNSVGQTLSRSFYQVRNLEQLDQVFSDVVRSGRDPLREVRREAAATLFPHDIPASEFIIEHLRDQFYR